MANNKELSIKRVRCSESIRGTEQRDVTQTDGLLGKVIENRWLYGICLDLLRNYGIVTE